MTAQTPIYAIKYPVVGEPIRTTRQILQDNAETVEAALVAGGITPPGASDLVSEIGARQAADTALSGRVTALEPGAWQTLTLNAGYTALGSGYTPPRARLLTAKVLELQFTLSAAPAGTAFTLPAGMRPIYNTILQATHGASGTMQVTVLPSGAVQPVAAATAFLSVNQTFPLD